MTQPEADLDRDEFVTTSSCERVDGRRENEEEWILTEAEVAVKTSDTSGEDRDRDERAGRPVNADGGGRRRLPPVTAGDADHDGVERLGEHQVALTDDRRAQTTAVRPTTQTRRRLGELGRPAADEDQPTGRVGKSRHVPHVDVDAAAVVPTLVDFANAEQKPATVDRRHHSTVEDCGGQQSSRRQRRRLVGEYRSVVVDWCRRHSDQRTDDDDQTRSCHHIRVTSMTGLLETLEATDRRAAFYHRVRRQRREYCSV